MTGVEEIGHLALRLLAAEVASLRDDQERTHRELQNSEQRAGEVDERLRVALALHRQLTAALMLGISVMREPVLDVPTALEPVVKYLYDRSPAGLVRRTQAATAAMLSDRAFNVGEGPIT